MCISPGTLPNGVQFACRKCKQCIDNYILDWSGRCIAEMVNCRAPLFVSLTYGRDPLYGTVQHERAVALTYTDVQTFIRALRDAGNVFRYVAVGEYGSEKGRAHWHLLMFFRDREPAGIRKDLPRFTWDFWPHGFSEVGDLHIGGVRYAMKYIRKDRVSHLDGVRQSSFTMSKNPPLGDMFFRQRAQTFVNAGLSPRDLVYGFADVRTKAAPGKPSVPLKFYLHGKSRENFLEYFRMEWFRKYGNNDWPSSPLLEEYEDKLTREANAKEDFRLVQKQRYQGITDLPWQMPPYGGEVLWDEKRCIWYADSRLGDTWFWSYDENGEQAWQTMIVSAAEGAKLANSRLENALKEQRHLERYAREQSMLRSG